MERTDEVQRTNGAFKESHIASADGLWLIPPPRTKILPTTQEGAEASFIETIVGRRGSLRSILRQVEAVAGMNTTVLITGETGTGKEVIARAIHELSPRRNRNLVMVNCVAMPAGLLESELFGHERGAFTGALNSHVGRFALADRGTLFLDEIGDMPLELQPKLLRVLQEGEFERVGGNRTLRANVRVVAATNRDLEAAIVEGAFRRDLFYRLNVFPIEIPPLRERKEDIPLLVEYFVSRFARKAGKIIHGINKKTLELLLSYPWPGNIRELQNVVERSVIVCETENLWVDESWLSRQPVASQPKIRPALSQLATQEKEMIEAALRESGGRVSGPSGAAAKLGVRVPIPLPLAPVVFVLGDDSSLRKSLELLIRHEGWRPEAFASAQDFLECSPAPVPNCLVLALSLPGFSGLDLQKRVAIERPDTPIIFVTDRGDVATTVQAMKAGAVEFLTKPFRDDLLLTAIREALERSRLALGQAAKMRVVRHCYASLSPRERQVMGLLVSGLLNKQVGGELGISEHTVKVHRGRIMQKMQADSFAHLVRMAAKLGVALPRNPECDELSCTTFV